MFIYITDIFNPKAWKIGVNNGKTDIVTQFGTTWLPIIGWTLKLNFTVWHYFDSYSKPILPPIPIDEVWGNVKEKKKIREILKRKCFVFKENIRSISVKRTK